ncbi:hypothetical protein SLS55_000101 [Diplodia seriata]|uniref:NWD NACHT-NTPase N-terminal domain-containing protein n=1 Tax=Diplodia seriata TaxID=420778 RepID=A0ABR3CU94_9PEZI
MATPALSMPSSQASLAARLQKDSAHAKSLWDRAFDELDAHDRQRLAAVQPDRLTVLEDVLDSVEQKKQTCLEKRWAIRKPNGDRVILRDLCEKVVCWIDKFKAVGDAATQYDPGHAALPWAAVRFVLQVAVNDHHMFSAMLEGVEHTSYQITRCAIIEMLYLGPPSSRLDLLASSTHCHLQSSIVRLYSSILQYLARAGEYYSKSTAKRILESATTVQDAAVKSSQDSIRGYEEQVLRCLQLCEQASINEVLVQEKEEVKHPFGSLATWNTKEQADDLGLEMEKLSLRDCTAEILKLCSKDPVVIIIDALDECDPSRRHELLESVEKIIRESVNLVKVFITSRDDDDIMRELERYCNICIHGTSNAEDIENFVQVELGRLLETRRLLGGNISEQLRYRIVERLVDGAQGMFRWVSLQLQNISDHRRFKLPEDVDSELGQLPQTLTESYELIYQQIVNLGPSSKQLAGKVISWLLCSMCHLEAASFVAALGFKTDANSVSVKVIPKVCCNLVIFDHTLGSSEFIGGDNLNEATPTVTLDITVKSMGLNQPDLAAARSVAVSGLVRRLRFSESSVERLRVLLTDEGTPIGGLYPDHNWKLPLSNRVYCLCVRAEPLWAYEDAPFEIHGKSFTTEDEFVGEDAMVMGFALVKNENDRGFYRRVGLIRWVKKDVFNKCELQMIRLL